MPRQSSNWTRVIPNVNAYNRLAQMTQPRLSPGDGFFRTGGGYDRAGAPIAATQPTLRGADPVMQPLPDNPYANPVSAMQPRTAGSMWNTVRGGYTPVGSGFTGTPSMYSTTWTRDLSAPGGWVPRAQPAGIGGGWGSYATNPTTGAAVRMYDTSGGGSAYPRAPTNHEI